MKIKVIYSPKVVAESGNKVSPSANKPKLLAEYLQSSNLNQFIEFVEPTPVSLEDIKRCHEPALVEEVMELKRPNGFGTICQSVAISLPYTNGAMYTATKLAFETKQPTCAIVAGFHHAGYNGWKGLGYFCTFNGLMISATKLVEEGICKKVAIVDCDMHWGNGTDNIIAVIDPKNERYLNISFGKIFGIYAKPAKYLEHFEVVKQQLKAFNPDVIIYQSGADVHKNDPFGGILSEQEMYQRDINMFQVAKDLDIPIAWTLAGGYQRDKDGGCSYVLKLHANTFEACLEVYNGDGC